jgi:DnaJ-class molecular chaperone
MPQQLSEEQRRLLESFAASEREDTYRADESLFDKLKSHFR